VPAIGQLSQMREASRKAILVPFLLLVSAIVAVPLLLLDSEGLPRYRLLRAEVTRVQTKNERLRREIRELRGDATRLRSDPRALERIARDELGMVRDGEIVFQFPN
jgi:cell division protein FtsB